MTPPARDDHYRVAGLPASGLADRLRWSCTITGSAIFSLVVTGGTICTGSDGDSMYALNVGS
jgi:hypothetical protein